MLFITLLNPKGKGEEAIKHPEQLKAAKAASLKAGILELRLG